MIEPLVITIEPDDFLSFVPEDLYKRLNKDYNARNIIKAFCKTVNDFRSGIKVVQEIPVYHFKRLTFRNCTTVDETGKEFVLKSHNSNVGLVGQVFTIYMTDSRLSKVVSDGNKIIWHCVKDPNRAFPKCGKELLKLKFAGHGSENIDQLLKIHDDYVHAYIAEYNRVLEESRCNAA